MKNKTIIKIIVIFILLLGLPSFLSLIPNIYYSETKKTNANQTLENPEQYYENVHRFLNNKEPLKQEFTEAETRHMKDVKLLFNIIRSTTLILLLIITLNIIYLYNKKREEKITEIKTEIKKATTITLGIILTLILLIIINFETTFHIFHHIFFPQGNWTFPYDSLLITLFPETFFMNLATRITITTLAITTILKVFLTKS